MEKELADDIQKRHNEIKTQSPARISMQIDTQEKLHSQADEMLLRAFQQNIQDINEDGLFDECTFHLQTNTGNSEFTLADLPSLENQENVRDPKCDPSS